MLLVNHWSDLWVNKNPFINSFIDAGVINQGINSYYWNSETLSGTFTTSNAECNGWTSSSSSISGFIAPGTCGQGSSDGACQFNTNGWVQNNIGSTCSTSNYLLCTCVQLATLSPTTSAPTAPTTASPTLFPTTGSPTLLPTTGSPTLTPIMYLYSSPIHNGNFSGRTGANAFCYAYLPSQIPPSQCQTPFAVIGFPGENIQAGVIGGGVPGFSPTASLLCATSLGGINDIHLTWSTLWQVGFGPNVLSSQCGVSATGIWTSFVNPSTNNCNDWTSSTITVLGTFVSSTASGSNWWSRENTLGCSTNTLAVLCGCAVIVTGSPTVPSISPTQLSPTFLPSKTPSRVPSRAPQRTPSLAPTPPSASPTRFPTNFPSQGPTLPSSSPTTQSPTTKNPQKSPQETPSLSPKTSWPSRNPTHSPSLQPSRTPSRQPSRQPSKSPSKQPFTSQPSRSPTKSPSKSPSKGPSTSKPSRSPSRTPSTSKPSWAPTFAPTKSPTPVPTTDFEQPNIATTVALGTTLGGALSTSLVLAVVAICTK